MPTIEEMRNWTGRTAVDPDGDKVGKIDHLYLDRQTGEPTFAAVKTGLFGLNHSFVPVAGASVSGDDITLAYDKDKVKDAPNVDPDGQLSEAEEATLYAHYDIAGYSRYEGEDHASITAADRRRDDERGAGRDTLRLRRDGDADDVRGEQLGDPGTTRR